MKKIEIKEVVDYGYYFKLPRGIFIEKHIQAYYPIVETNFKEED
jgi:hypothetical protein